MKKRNLILVSTFMLSFFMVTAQNTNKGDKIINLGLGFGNNFTAGGSDFSNSFPPISASFELIVKEDLFSDGKGSIGVGGYAQYMNYNYASINNNTNTSDDIFGLNVLKSAAVSSSENKWKYNKFIIGPRGILHYSFLDKLDTYTGLMLGLDYVSWSIGNSNYNNTAFIWAWVLGGRYYFNENLAGMLELGYGATYANIGIAYKIGK